METKSVLVRHNDKDIEILTSTEVSHTGTLIDESTVREIFFENVYQVGEGDLGDTGVVVDIGGNIGAFDLFCWALGAKKIITFEPDTKNLAILKQNIIINKVDNVSVQPFAITKKSGEYRLLNGRGASFLDSVEYTPTPEAEAMLKDKNIESEIVHGITLGEALIANNIDYAAILKIDCEGGEYDIIESTPADTLNHFRYITMEFHATDETTFGKMIAKLSLTHSVHTLGKYNVGGQIYAQVY